MRESYITASQKLEQDFSLSKITFDPMKIVAIETYLAVEKALLRHVEESLLTELTVVVDKVLSNIRLGAAGG